MDDEIYGVGDKIQELNDLELACLTCLVAEQRCCIITTDANDLKSLEKEVLTTCQDTFGLRCAVVRCDRKTTCDDFSRAILVKDESRDGSDHDDYLSSKAVRRLRANSRTLSDQSEGQIANVIVTTGLNHAPEQVQIQALELVRSGRTFSRKEVHVAPTQFFVISLQETGDQSLHFLLNDQVFLSHEHDAEAFGDDDGADAASVADSMASVIRSPPATPGVTTKRKSAKGVPYISLDEIKHLQTLTLSVAMSPDIRAYLHDLTIYLRNHRAVAGGVSANATMQLHLLSRVLAALHSMSFISPTLVALAARKIYPHRLVLVRPEQERSLQWGSSIEAVRELLKGITVEDVIEQVLESVETPL